MFWILFWNEKFNSKYFNAVIGWRFLNVRKTTCDYYSPQNAKIHVRTLVCKNVTQYIRMPTKLFCVLAAICHSTTFRHKVCVCIGAGGAEYCAVCRNIHRHTIFACINVWVWMLLCAHIEWIVNMQISIYISNYLFT